uniref:Uncharacterized protein n=1 Tax=viral metagenome TaxID=1070528 RepID=A0A6C0IXY1_9ZZZZ
MSRKNSGSAIVFFLMVILLIILLIKGLMNYTHTPKNTKFHSRCERYHNWAWIHAPRDGLVSQVNDLDA